MNIIGEAKICLTCGFCGLCAGNDPPKWDIGRCRKCNKKHVPVYGKPRFCGDCYVCRHVYWRICKPVNECVRCVDWEYGDDCMKCGHYRLTGTCKTCKIETDVCGKTGKCETCHTKKPSAQFYMVVG